MLRVERQNTPASRQDRVKRGEARRRKDQHRDRIGEPVLFALRRDAGEPVESAFDRAEDRRKQGALAGKDARHVKAERTRGERDQAENEADLQPAGKGHGELRRISEALGIEQGENEIDPEQDGHDQAEDRFEHVWLRQARVRASA